jgi:hypothetical protein
MSRNGGRDGKFRKGEFDKAVFFENIFKRLFQQNCKRLCYARAIGLTNKPKSIRSIYSFEERKPLGSEMNSITQKPCYGTKNLSKIFYTTHL